jgi:hypothetical protein
MESTPLHFIGEPIEVGFNQTPLLEKTPPCPDYFIWRGVTYIITETLSEWRDYERRGRMSRNMQPAHAERADIHGSWGVGRFYFMVRVTSGRIFKLYYDRAPKDTASRKGAWFLMGEFATSETDTPYN